MKIPTQLVLNFLHALEEGARELDRSTPQGAISAASLTELVRLLLQNHPEPDVAGFYRDAVVDKLEQHP